MSAVKKGLALLIILMLTASIAGCGGSKSGNTTSNTTSTLTKSGTGDHYFSTDLSALEMVNQAKAAKDNKATAKAIIQEQVYEHWDLIRSKFGFRDRDQAYAFFLGFATRESTLDMSCETAGDFSDPIKAQNSAHSYGLLQTAETAYKDTGASYIAETDVPEMTHYAFTAQNFYDPEIAVHMGIRHLIHFANSAKEKGYTGIEILRHAVLGFNTGWVDGGSNDWMADYVDEMGALAQWYYKEKHLTDNTFTWHTDSRAESYRNDPWGWTGIK